MLREILKRILTEWPNATHESFTDHPLAQAIRQQLRDAISSIISEKYPSYIVSGSAGAGNWSNVPWLSILNPEITKSTQDGIYPVYLFRADGTGVYLSINQGTTTPQKLLGKAKADLQANSIVIKMRAEVPRLAEWGAQQVELAASTALGKSYEKPNIAARFYPANSLPSEEELKADLLTAMKIYEDIEPIWRVLQNQDDLTSLSSTGHMILKASLNEFRKQLHTNLTQAGLRVSESLLLRLASSLLAKRFLILTGLSGSGKTKLAHAFVSWLTESKDQYRLVAVGADWTTNENVVGYQDALQPDIYRKPSNGLLDVILRAAADILTNEIMHGAFDLKVDEYKQVKSLDCENLRDHMTDIELILTMLAEATTTELHRDRDSQGMEPLTKDAKDGGAVAGRTRKDIEQQTGKLVISTENFKQLAGVKSKRLKKGDD